MNITLRSYLILALPLLALPPLFAQTSTGATGATGTPPASSDQVVVLNPFDVTGSADRGYQTANASGATKTNTPIIDLAFSIQELNPEFIQDVDPKDIYDAARYVSSVARGDTRVDSLTIRGFTAALSNDGLLYFGENILTDPANIERMEVIKGASAVLYGSAAAGGLINVIHKTANDERQDSLELETGSYSFYRGVLDSNIPILKTGDTELDYRLIVSGQDSRDYQDFYHVERYLISNNLDFKVGPNTDIKLRVDYTDLWGINNPSLTYDYNGVLLHESDSFYRGEPSIDWQHNHYLTAQLTAEERFSEDWALKVSSSYRREVFTNTPPTDPTQWVRYEQIIPNIIDASIDEADLVGNFKIGPTKHQLLLGVFGSVEQNPTGNYRYGPLTPNFNVINPVYGPGIYTVGPLVASALRVTFSESYDWAVFAQDQITLLNDKLILTGGGREDYNQITNTNESPLATGQLTTSQTYTKASPRFAALYKVTDGLSLYASYDQSFTPAPGTNSFAGAPFPPPTAVQRETGFKYAVLDGRISGSGSVFEIQRNNITTADPINPGFLVATGQVETKGWEVDSTAFITQHWQIFGGFGHYHNYDSIDTVPANIGEVFVGIPSWSMGAFTKYDFAGTWLNGFSVGLGVTGMSGIAIDTGINPITTKASYILNPEMAYVWGSWRFSVTTENILNNHYIEFASSDRYAQPGNDRAIYFTVKKTLDWGKK